MFWGPAPVVSSNGHHYFLSVVDDFSKYIWLFPMACKSDVTTFFIKFKRIVENFFSRSIKSIQTDSGGEFIPLQRFLHTAGISYRQTCPHTHYQNGSVECRHRHIVELGSPYLPTQTFPFSIGRMPLTQHAI
jgi:IS30 family transposase